jgi:hypothetical protein
MFGVMFTGFFGVMDRVQTVTMRNMGMVSCLHMVTRLIVPGGLAMMMGCIFMMISRGAVVIGGFLVFGHALLLPVVRVEQAPDVRRLDRV